jgi:hypothetical protein
MFEQHPLFFSEPHIVVPDNYWKNLAYHLSMSCKENHGSPLLGEILQQAALISQQQVQLALREQKDYHHLKIGEILALHGWIDQETANFFAQQWLELLKSPRSYPIGHYLQQACLLDEKQIQRILTEQKRLNLPFGELAVLDGFLKPQTRDFFLENLPPKKVMNPKATESTIEIAQRIIKNLPKNEKDLEIEKETIPWIG